MIRMPQVTTKLSDAQVKALEDFEFGHGYGENAYLSKPTAKKLEALGLVTLHVKWKADGRKFHWGQITSEGREALRQLRGRR